MIIGTGFFPHFQVLKWFSIESSLIEWAETIQSLIIFLFIGCLVKLNGFIYVLIYNCSLFMQNSWYPFRIRKLFDKFLCDVTVRTQWNRQQQLTISAFLDNNWFRIFCLVRRLLLSSRNVFVWRFFASFDFLSLLLILGDNDVLHGFILKGTNDFKELFIAYKSRENILKLLGTGAGSTKERAAFSNSDECGFELL